MALQNPKQYLSCCTLLNMRSNEVMKLVLNQHVQKCIFKKTEIAESRSGRQTELERKCSGSSAPFPWHAQRQEKKLH